MDIKYNYDDVWNVSIEGDLDIVTSNKLKDVCNEILDQKEDNIIFDFSNLKYIDSTGLGAIILLVKRIKLNNNTISIKNAKKSIVKLIKLSGLDLLIELKGEDND